MVDIHHTDKRLENAKKLFREMCKPCFLVMSRYDSDLRADNRSKQRLLKHWRDLKVVHGLLGICFDKANKDDLKRLIITINEKDDWAEETKANRKLMTKMFYRWFVKGELKGECPDIVKWISTKVSKSKERPPESILTVEDVKNLVQGAETQFDRALISILFWSGGRIGEISNCRISDIEPHPLGHVINVSGKTGGRKIKLLNKECCEELDKWLSEHPSKNDRNSYIFVKKIKRTGEIRIPSREYIHKRIKAISQKVGIRKPVNPHAFRFGLATYFASKDISPMVMNEHFGWSKNSDQATHYSRMSRRQIDNILLERIAGVKLGESDISEKPNECPKCRVINEHFENFCKSCSYPLSLKGVAEYDSEIFVGIQELRNKVGALSKTLVYIINQDKEMRNKVVSFIRDEGLESVLEN